MSDKTKKNIEEVKVGDSILSFDNDQKLQSAIVYEMESPMREGYYNVVLEDKTILKVTDEHPLYFKNTLTNEEGWASFSPEKTKQDSNMKVKQLTLGSFLKKEDGSWSRIENIKYISGSVQTYNLKSVQGNSFFAEGIWAHNKDEFEPWGYFGVDCDMISGWACDRDNFARDPVTIEIYNQNNQLLGTTIADKQTGDGDPGIGDHCSDSRDHEFWIETPDSIRQGPDTVKVLAKNQGGDRDDTWLTGVSAQPITCPTCSVSKNPTSIGYSGKSNGTKVRLYIQRKDNTQVPGGILPGENINADGKYYYLVSSCPSSGLATCSGTYILPTNLPMKEYEFHCDTESAIGKCSGSPNCAYEGLGGTYGCEGWGSCTGTAGSYGGDNGFFSSWTINATPICPNSLITPTMNPRVFYALWPPSPLTWQYDTYKSGTHTVTISGTSSNYVYFGMEYDNWNVVLKPYGSPPHSAITYIQAFNPLTDMATWNPIALPSGTYNMQFELPLEGCLCPIGSISGAPYDSCWGPNAPPTFRGSYPITVNRVQFAVAAVDGDKPIPTNEALWACNRDWSPFTDYNNCIINTTGRYNWGIRTKNSDPSACGIPDPFNVYPVGRIQIDADAPTHTQATASYNAGTKQITFSWGSSDAGCGSCSSKACQYWLQGKWTDEISGEDTGEWPINVGRWTPASYISPSYTGFSCTGHEGLTAKLLIRRANDSKLNYSPDLGPSFLIAGTFTCPAPPPSLSSLIIGPDNDPYEFTGTRWSTRDFEKAAPREPDHAYYENGESFSNSIDITQNVVSNLSGGSDKNIALSGTAFVNQSLSCGALCTLSNLMSSATSSGGFVALYVNENNDYTYVGKTFQYSKFYVYFNGSWSGPYELGETFENPKIQVEFKKANILSPEFEGYFFKAMGGNKVWDTYGYTRDYYNKKDIIQKLNPSAP